MYHISNLGKNRKYVEQYADINGYVPDEGDTPDQFTWDAMGDQWDDLPESAWEEFVAASVAATAEATA